VRDRVRRQFGILVNSGKFACVEGAQLVEFAITLPLLAVLFVGIYDFGQAVNLKQKLTEATREGARFAANQATIDITNTPPPSILAVRDVVDAYLVTNKISDCGLSTINSPARTPGTWVWTFTATGCGGGSLVLSIDRGLTYTYTEPNTGNLVTVEATQVNMTYPYQWQFSSVLQLLPRANYTTTNIGAQATMQNMN
jgi:Flp pilus assembly protein TadG